MFTRFKDLQPFPRVQRQVQRSARAGQTAALSDWTRHSQHHTQSDGASSEPALATRLSAAELPSLSHPRNHVSTATLNSEFTQDQWWQATLHTYNITHISQVGGFKHLGVAHGKENNQLNEKEIFLMVRKFTVPNKSTSSDAPHHFLCTCTTRPIASVRHNSLMEPETIKRHDKVTHPNTFPK